MKNLKIGSLFKKEKKDRMPFIRRNDNTKCIINVDEFEIKVNFFTEHTQKKKKNQENCSSAFIQIIYNTNDGPRKCTVYEQSAWFYGQKHSQREIVIYLYFIQFIVHQFIKRKNVFFVGLVKITLSAYLNCF